MPRLSVSPVPKKRFHGGRWRIFWKWNYKQYSVATDYTDVNKRAPVDIDLRLIAGALAMEKPIFPEKYQKAPKVVEYLKARYPSPDGSTVDNNPAAWLDDYEKEMKGQCSPEWVRDSVSRLRKLETKMGSLDKITPKMASSYLADFADNHKITTRNRALAMFFRFFNWAVRTEILERNPFKGIKMLPEEKSSFIIYCTRDERDEIIKLASTTGWPEWFAVPLAFFTGMRRGEITRLEWTDINFGAQDNINIRKTKTKIDRVLPMNKDIKRLLLDVPEAERVGSVVTFTEGRSRIWRLENLLRTIQKSKRKELLAQWNILRPPPSRSKDYPAKKAEFESQKKQRNNEIKANLERIGWNSFSSP